MSSYVIDKVNYVRVGALVAGIYKGIKEQNNIVWFYDDETGEVLKGWGFVQKFLKCYYMNVESVNKQYNLKDNESAENDDDYNFDSANPNYIEEYVRYFKYGKMIVGNTLEMMDVAWDLIAFSRSVSYQIEDPVCNVAVMEWFNAVITKIVRFADMNEESRGQWGEFDLHLDREPALN